MKKLFFLPILLTLFAAPLHASITFVQAPAACVSDNYVNSFTCTFAKPVTAGDTLILSTMPLLTPEASPFVVSASDTVNGNWAQGVQCYTAYAAQADFFYFTNTAAGSDTVTVTYSGLWQPAELYISLAEYSGVDTSSPFDGPPACTAYLPHTPFTGPTITTTNAGDWLISSMIVGNAGASSVSSPYIPRVPNFVTIADVAPGTTGTQPGPTWTTQYTQDGFVVAAALRPTGGGGGPTTVTVGPSGQYATPCAAFAHLADGDTVQIDANGGVPYQDLADCKVANSNLTIVGVNGRPIIDGSKAAIAKALWVVDGHDDAIDNFEFRNANNVSKDSSTAAGILIEDSNGNGGTTPAGGNITVKRSYLHDNFNGIVSDDAGNGSGEWFSANPFITLQYDEFANNGHGGGHTHNVFVGYGGNMNFTLQFSWSHDAYVGDAVKSRAPINNIRYNLIGDSVGNGSYLLDLPQGGSGYIVGNSFYKMATTNPKAQAAMMLFADVTDNTASTPEYGAANQDLHFVNNTAVLDPANRDSPASIPPAFVLDSCSAASNSACPAPANGPDLTVPGVVENNIFFGAETAGINQSSAFVENNLLTSNSSSTNLASLNFNNAAAFDFRLLAGSPGIGAGVYPPTGNSGSSDANALAADEYVQPVSMTAWPTPSGTSMDAGAFSSGVPIATPSLHLSYSTTVQAGNTGTITVTGLPTPSTGQYNYAAFLSGNEAIVSGTSTLGSASGEGDIESVASSTTSVTTTFSTSAVTSTTVVPIYIYVDGTVLTANVTVTPVAASPASITAISGSGQSATVGTQFANPLVAIVKDVNSNPVSGATVTFSGTGVSFPSGATAVTVSNGEAQVTAQPTSAGPLTVNASVTGVSTPASFSETGTTPTASSITAVSGSGQSATVGTQFANPLVAIVRDINSNSVSGATVTFSGTGVSFPSGAIAVTGSNGEAQVTAQPTSAGPLTVNASVTGVSTSASFSETGTPIGTPGTIAFVQAPAACVSSGSVTSFTCKFAKPVASGDTLILSTMALLAPGPSPSTVAVSDTVNGSWTQGVQCYSAYDAQANFFYLANTAAGSDTVTVAYSGLRQPAKLYISMAEYSGVNTSSPFDAAPACTSYLPHGPFTGPTLTTTQPNDLLISTMIVGNAGKSSVSSPYVLRVPKFVTIADDAPGIAGQQAGPTWTVQYNQDGFVVGAALRAANSGGAAPASIAAVSGSGQSAAVGTQFANPLIAIVKDVNSNPISGATVTFSGTGVSYPSGAIAVTASNGEAQVMAQPTSSGPLTISASVSGVSTSASFSETGTTPTASSIAAVSGSGQSATVGTQFANPLVAIVKDVNSNPVSGATVTFSGTGISFPSGATAVTGSNGEAQVMAQPTSSGPLTISASVAGVSTSASFSETGTPATTPVSLSVTPNPVPPNVAFSYSVAIGTAGTGSNPVGTVTLYAVLPNGATTQVDGPNPVGSAGQGGVTNFSKMLSYSVPPGNYYAYAVFTPAQGNSNPAGTSPQVLVVAQ